MQHPLGNRARIRRRFQDATERDELLVGAAVGSGLFAEAAEQGGADFILALNAGRFRLMGVASVACMLPIRDSNMFVESFGADEFVGRCSAPVFFGASVMSPDANPSAVAEHVMRLGFSGIMNFPTVAHYPVAMQAVAEAGGFGFSRELELLRIGQRLDLWTVCHVCTREQARLAAAAGLDMVCFNYGWNAGGRRGMACRLTLHEAAMVAREVAKVVRDENPDTLLVLEGGPIESTEDLKPIYRAAQVNGYVGGSTIDRLPLEDAVANQTLRFKGAAAATRRYSEQDQSLLSFGSRHGFIGASQRMMTLYRALSHAIDTGKWAFVITGEVGSGRQYVAEVLLQTMARRPGQIMTLDAHEISAQRLMIALFGRDDVEDKGRTLQGAVRRHEIAGLIIRGFERLPAHTQRRIARFLSRGAFRPVGSKREETGTLRMIFVSERSQRDLTDVGTIHRDLQRELESREIAVPALREYIEDLEALMTDMATRMTEAPCAMPKLSPAALRRLQTYGWPGNLTELRAFVKRLVAATTDRWINDTMVAELLTPEGRQLSRPVSERDLILDALWRHGFHRIRTARFLGISRKTLFNKIRRYKLSG